MVDMTTHRAAWQDLANRLGAQRPSVGKTVKVIAGKKYLGKIGTVTWHGIDKYNRDAWRYGDNAQHAYREMAGTYGYRVRIQPNDGGEMFYIQADRVEVVIATNDDPITDFCHTQETSQTPFDN